MSGCTDPAESSWGGQFAGDRVRDVLESAGESEYPMSFIGTYGADALSINGNDCDILGSFVAIHEDVGAIRPASICDVNAALCPPLTID